MPTVRTFCCCLSSCTCRAHAFEPWRQTSTAVIKRLLCCRLLALRSLGRTTQTQHLANSTARYTAAALCVRDCCCLAACQLTTLARTALVQAPPAPVASGRPNLATSCTSAEVWTSSHPENILLEKKNAQQQKKHERFLENSETKQNKKKTKEVSRAYFQHIEQHKRTEVSPRYLRHMFNKQAPLLFDTRDIISMGQ